jgi:hypothetical protein
MVQYEHAKNIDGKPIHISEVNKNEKIRYFCIVCDKELIPKTGDINEHHFAHKNKNIDCSKEKYFQLLGKMLFLEIYNKCKHEKIPFNIKIKDQCINEDILCKKNNYSIYNLLDYFENIEMGYQYDFLISDLKIFNEKNESLFIVTYYFHIINQNNDYGNNRVIEIKIKCEDDFKNIKNKLLSEENENIIFHNFKRKFVLADNCKNCQKHLSKYIQKNVQNVKFPDKYILLNYNGKIECKIIESLKLPKIIKSYRYIKMVNPNIDYYSQYNEFISECKNRKWNIIEFNDFW